MSNSVTVAKNEAQSLGLLPDLINRHGCLAGATDAGETVTCSLSRRHWLRGVPVLMAEFKSDLSGLGKAGLLRKKPAGARRNGGLPQPQWRAAPVAFWDVLGERGAAGAGQLGCAL